MKFINIFRPILILLEKILQSGSFNNNNFSLFSNEIFLLTDQISEKCVDIITNIQLENNNNNIYSNIYISPKNNNNNSIEAKKFEEFISLPYKTFFFWYLILL